MAEEPAGVKKDPVREWWLFTRIFTAFRLAYHPYKLILAASGILTMALGWWLLATLFFGWWPTPPVFDKYLDYYKDRKDGAEVAWKSYKQDLNQWNLLYKLAGGAPAIPEKEGKPRFDEVPERSRFGPADLANSREEHDLIVNELKAIEVETSKRSQPVTAGHTPDERKWWLLVGKVQIDVKADGVPVKDFMAAFAGTTAENKRTAGDLEKYYDSEKKQILLVGLPLTVLNKEQWEVFRDGLQGRSLEEIQKDVINRPNPEVSRKALELLFLKARGQFKPSGYLCTWPWFEERGENPFLIVTGQAKVVTAEGIRNVPWARGEFFTWLLNDQVPMLLEPLFKFLAPVMYLFNPAAGLFVWTYLILVILWTLATWAFFGGAITRLAAVQAARPNERYDITDAWKFARKHYLDFLIAPLLPLAILGALGFVFLAIPGLLINLLPWGLGDIPAGLLFILVLILGFIMALGVVGLVGYPLMYSTVSTEGTDSFDGLSRSYSYVFQAPWRYLWNCTITLLYGAAVIFFVGLLGSLTVYMGKWGLTRMQIYENREVSYLYAWAPTSFGWRDLLLTGSPHTEAVPQIGPSGKLEAAKRVSPAYLSTFADFPSNLAFIGTFLVTVWLYVLFLAVVGFGYSYFWCATAIIYLLMRRAVDDNELTTVSLDDVRPPVPYVPPTIPSSQAKPAKAGEVSLTVVEAPASRTTSPPPTMSPAAAHPAAALAEPVRSPAEAVKPVKPVEPPPTATPINPDGNRSGSDGEPK